MTYVGVCAYPHLKLMDLKNSESRLRADPTRKRVFKNPRPEGMMMQVIIYSSVVISIPLAFNCASKV